MQFSFSTMHSSISDMDRSCRPLWLTSASFEFPSYALLNPNLSDRIALILYYAHIMDQKKLLSDFYKLCKCNFDNKYESSVLELSINTWIKHSIVKLHRRREQIISEAVSTWKTQMIFSISQILFDVFCDLLGDPSKIGSSVAVYPRSKRHISAYNGYLKNVYAGNEMLLPNCSRFKDFQADIGCDKLFFGLPFKENNNQLSVSKTHPMPWLRKFWLEFCYQPDPMNCIHSMQHASEKVDKKTDFNYSSQNDFSVNMDIKFLLNSNDSFSSVSSNDSDSSDSWSCTDFADESPYEDDTPRSIASNGNFLQKCNATMAWLQSTSCRFTEWSSDSDDESVIFGDAITEENCLDRAGNKGSLCFVDINCSDEDDDFEVIFLSDPSGTSFTLDTYEEESQGYENPCFEDAFSLFSVPSFIKTVNECWSEEMLDIKDKPRKPSRVSFAPESSLVTVHCFEKTEDNTFDASLVLDRLRFQYRIREFGRLLTPFLTSEHRAEIQQRNGFYQD